MASIYGFAQLSTSGSGATEALRLYNRAVAQSAGESGLIENPDIFREARQKYLEPYADDIRVSTKMAESVNEENRLRDKINDVNLASSVFKESVDGMIRDYAKSYYQNPQNLILTTAYVYNTAVDELADEIENRRASGQSVGELQSLLTNYSRKADSMTRLARQTLAGKPQNPNAYGWFIRTNPDDGSIIDIALDVVDSIERQSGYKRTNSMYGNVPVWTNTVTDENGKEVARIGSNKFELEKDSDTGAEILKNTAKQWGRYFKSLLPGGEKPSEAKEAVRTLNLGAIQFGDVLNLPQGSIAKDASGRYYYYGSDGVYKANKKEDLEKFLNFSGVPASDVDARAYPISRNEVQSFGSFTNEDGTSRIIDDKLLGGISAKATNQVNLLPPVEQRAREAFSAAPNPGNAPAPENQPAPFQVPRKSPGVKEPAQVGKQSTNDFLKESGKQFAEAFNPLIQPFRDLMRR